MSTTVGPQEGGSGDASLSGILIGNGNSPFTGLVLTAGQSIRRNAGDTAYEGYTPGGGGGTVDSVVGTANRITVDNTDPANPVLDIGSDVVTGGGTATGTNTGDQTSIVGITGTKAQFDTAVTDGNFLYVGDITQYTDEMAQDAVGGMVDTTLEYNDGVPSLRRAALTGAITASAGSNATALGSFTLSELNTALSDADVATGGGTATGTNTGDQTSIVGITGTKAQFDTAVTDGNFLYVGDVTQYTDEMAQDAVGGILDDGGDIDFTYDDGVPSITAAVKNDAITFAKMQNIATAKLLGRGTAGTGDVEEVTLGTNLSFTGTTLNAAGGSADIQVFTTQATRLTTSSSTQFDITNTAGNTYRYTYDGTGTDPGITSGTVPTGALVNVWFDNASPGNNGSFIVTGSGANYFEVTNTSGVVETNRTMTFRGGLFVSTASWTKPAGKTTVEVITIGAGGGGGGAESRATSNEREGGGGGGGGAFTKKIYRASDLGATEIVMVGVSGAAGTGGNSADGTSGTNGGPSAFGIYQVSYGGGAGTGGGSGRSGGSGGGTAGPGSVGDTASVIGGLPASSAGAGGIAGQGGGSTASTTATAGGNAEYGGGGGGSISSDSSTDTTAAYGGSSIYGGGGGGCGASISAANATRPPSNGGGYNSYVAGSGGKAGAIGADPSAGTSRSGFGAGDGGGGGYVDGGPAGGRVGGAGGAPGGGGGGGGGGTSAAAGNGGVGGRGEVIVISY